MESNLSFEVLKITLTVITPFIAAYLTYKYAIKSKLKDYDIQKKQELNCVISNLMIVWHFSTRLETIAAIKYNPDIDLPISKQHISFLVLNSGLFNDEIFADLDKSIENLKKHDPISFYELEGIGARFEFLKKNFLSPMLKSRSNSPVNKILSDKYLKETLSQIEDHIEIIAGRIDCEFQKELINKIHREPEKEIEEFRSDILLWIYDLVLVSQPNHVTFEEFMEEVKKPEVQEMINSQLTLVSESNLEQLLNQVFENPEISIEELQKSLSDLKVV